jgi:hypothetical protein
MKSDDNMAQAGNIKAPGDKMAAGGSAAGDARAAAEENAAVSGNARAANPTFTKEQLLASKRYRGSRDLLKTVLDDGITYSHGDVGLIIAGFMKGKVV